MARGIEGRLKKLEAAATRTAGVLFVKNEPGETKEQFEKRVERLIRESTERNGCPPLVFVMRLPYETPEPLAASGGPRTSSSTAGWGQLLQGNGGEE